MPATAGGVGLGEGTDSWEEVAGPEEARGPSRANRSGPRSRATASRSSPQVGIGVATIRPRSAASVVAPNSVNS